MVEHFPMVRTNRNKMTQGCTITSGMHYYKCEGGGER